MREAHPHAGEHHRPSLSAQLAGTMFDQAPERTAPPAEVPSLEERFRAFHEANPLVYEKLEREALSALRNGDRRVAVARLVENLRHDAALRTSGSPFQVDNSFRSLYGRMLVARRPELRAVIVLRERHGGGERHAS